MLTMRASGAPLPQPRSHHLSLANITKWHREDNTNKESTIEPLVDSSSQTNSRIPTDSSQTNYEHSPVRSSPTNHEYSTIESSSQTSHRQSNDEIRKMKFGYSTVGLSHPDDGHSTTSSSQTNQDNSTHGNSETIYDHTTQSSSQINTGQLCDRISQTDQGLLTLAQFVVSSTEGGTGSTKVRVHGVDHALSRQNERTRGVVTILDEEVMPEPDSLINGTTSDSND